MSNRSNSPWGDDCGDVTPEDATSALKGVVVFVVLVTVLIWSVDQVARHFNIKTQEHVEAPATDK
jgi:hypothetical protein